MEAIANLFRCLCCKAAKRKDVEENLVSTSMAYKLNKQPGEELATFGAGCYWGTEKYFVTNLQKELGRYLLGQAVGFMSADPDAKPNPTYREVCSGITGHVEVLHMRFDNRLVDYEKLVRFFFTFHDPTTWNKQGNDKGTQYASVIFYHNEKQREIAQMVKD